MTEREFREKLKNSLGSTGLSSAHQMRVLARMKGEERQVRIKQKWKLSMALLLIVMMTVGAAVAMEIVKYVDWDGKPVDYTPPEYVEYDENTDPIRDPVAAELVRSKALEEILIFFYEWRYQGSQTGMHSIEVGSLEELAQVAGEDALLPIPIGVPEGFTLASSSVHFAGKPERTYQLLGEEQHELSVRVKRYACDRDDLFPCSYFLFFENEAGERLSFSARLLWHEEDVLQAEDALVEVVQVEGMKQTVYIDHGEYRQVWTRRSLPEPAACQIAIIGPDGIEIPEIDRAYVSLELQCNSTVCDLSTMLACWGLAAE